MRINVSVKAMFRKCCTQVAQILCADYCSNSDICHRTNLQVRTHVHVRVYTYIIVLQVHHLVCQHV